MRKFLSMVVALCALVGFIGCDGTKNNDDEPVDYKKFVSKITRESPSENMSGEPYILSFSYDDKMRVSSIRLSELDGEIMDEGNFSYGTDQVTFSMGGTWIEDVYEPSTNPSQSKATVEKKHTMDAIMALSRGKIVSGVIESEEFEDGVSVSKDSEAWTLQYNSGFLSKKTVIYDEGGTAHTSTDECTWSGDNLVSVKSGGSNNYFTSTAEYNTKYINKADCNIDVNWLVYYDEFFECVDDTNAFDFLKYLGKPNKNLITKTVDGYNKKVYTYEYKFTTDGYVSEVQIISGDESKLLETIKIEYR